MEAAREAMPCHLSCTVIELREPPYISVDRTNGCLTSRWIVVRAPPGLWRRLWAKRDATGTYISPPGIRDGKSKLIHREITGVRSGFRRYRHGQRPGMIVPALPAYRQFACAP